MFRGVDRPTQATLPRPDCPCSYVVPSVQQSMGWKVGAQGGFIRLAQTSESIWKQKEALLE